MYFLLLETFYLEDIILVFIDKVLLDVENPSTELLASEVANRLFGEVTEAKLRHWLKFSGLKTMMVVLLLKSLLWWGDRIRHMYCSDLLTIWIL